LPALTKLGAALWPGQSSLLRQFFPKNLDIVV
jgi:hypothetical protein